VAVSSFIIGIVFLVLLRFLVGIVVWISIFLVFLLLLAGGALCYVRHTQCAGVGLFESGHQLGVGVALAGQNALNGGGADESMSGDGEDYRGAQTRTRTGRLCQDWNTNTPHVSAYTNASYPNADLNGNSCRNPNGVAQSIWCYTTDVEKRWELCTPVGVINAECAQGYAVESGTMRKALEIIAFVIWGICALWVILVCCMCRQIMLAIAVNKVAASFTAENPPVLFVLPFTQIFIGILWCLAWAVSASFLLSQVPKDQVPTAFYATYAEAYGTDDTEGKCTAAFVNGDVYKYPGDMTATDDPCTGNLGDITGITPRCWACFPPRFVIDWRFAISFFVYLWNTAFLIAVGQFIVASACCVWFFAPSGEKGKQRPLRTGVWHCFRYHLGSLAFGAFLIALVQFIRYTLMYFEKQAMAAKNRLMACVLRIVQCCLYCLEKCIKFLNKNAYIQIALMGKGFCTSAKNAVMLILRNMGRFGWVTLLSGMVNFIGVCFIVVATAVAGFFILKAMHPDVTPVMPMIVYVFLAYMVAKLFMNVFHLACGTVLQCFLATEEMSKDDPSFDKSFVPAPMRTFVNGISGSEKADS
jgi:solute carrier family 44 protein 1 (choline transporter-like protein)/choline transporter-like protein 2/4/5